MGKKYNRNINVKHYSSVEEILDSVNNDPKRPGYQIAYIDRASNFNTKQAWLRHLSQNGYHMDDVAEKRPHIGNEEYVALIIEAEPHEVMALKFTI